MQRPSIEAVRELGYRSLVVDANPAAVCVPFADRFEQVDLKDRDSLASLALSLGSSLAAVFTAGTDFSASVSYVAEKCSLKSHPFQAALNASDKTLMRSCFEKASVPSPAFVKVARADLATYLKKGLEAMTFPKVVKPVDNMGARGCRLIRSPDEFLHSVEDAVSYSRTGKAILEDYMDGPEFSIDALLYDGTLTITGFADRHIFYSPYFIEMGHTMPSSFDEEKKKELVATFARGIASLGLTHGACKADIKYTASGPMVGEIAARLSGGYMSGWTYPYASGLNLTKEAVKLALGERPDQLEEARQPLELGQALPFKVYSIPCTATSAERAWISIPGRVKEVLALEKAETEPFVRNVMPRAAGGDRVDFPRNNVEKCGNVIAVSKCRELAVQAAENAVSSIVLRLEANSRETDAFLAGTEQFCEKGFPPDAFVLDDEGKETVLSFASKLGSIRKDSPCSKIGDAGFLKVAENIRDWNHRSLLATLELFDRLCPEHPELDALKFFEAAIRGGLQGLIYMRDSC
ncbi:MAG: ATP-grasp domain-containing protein [Treponema sp.]|nr:ATP-grasp domain-containing protein [Treponema sp.]